MRRGGLTHAGGEGRSSSGWDVPCFLVCCAGRRGDDPVCSRAPCVSGRPVCCCGAARHCASGRSVEAGWHCEGRLCNCVLRVCPAGVGAVGGVGDGGDIVDVIGKGVGFDVRTSVGKGDGGCSGDGGGDDGFVGDAETED